MVRIAPDNAVADLPIYSPPLTYVLLSIIKNLLIIIPSPMVRIAPDNAVGYLPIDTLVQVRCLHLQHPITNLGILPHHAGVGVGQE